MKERVILHSDLNNFYASVECLHRPEIRDKPVAVCGDPLLRHGIVLAKNYPAKATGIQTGEAIWQAQQKCPGLVVLPPIWLIFSLCRWPVELCQLYRQVEPFGLDWMKLMDVGGSCQVLVSVGNR
jgi:DNA polymerase-4